MGMSSAYGPPMDKQEAIALIRTAVDRGVYQLFAGETCSVLFEQAMLRGSVGRHFL
jgi:hypothetical protein